MSSRTRPSIDGLINSLGSVEWPSGSGGQMDIELSPGNDRAGIAAREEQSP